MKGKDNLRLLWEQFQSLPYVKFPGIMRIFVDNLTPTEGTVNLLFTTNVFIDF